MLKKIDIIISGMHCISCKTLIETEIDILPGVKSIEVDHKTGQGQVELDDQKTSQKKILLAIAKLGYKVEDKTISRESKNKPASNRFSIIVAIIAIFLLSYYAIQKYNLLEVLARLNESNLSLWLILFIGFLSSFHCIGMCGGLVVTYTATHQAKRKEKTKSYLPHWQYNLGRLISYTAVGAILGGFGSFFGINPVFTGVITLLAGGFMVLMGLSLITHFKWLKAINLRPPAFIARFLFNQRHSKKPKGPLIIGLLTGFMPCGPLQAMQLYALATGSVVQGALAMAIYALGTIPLMFGFGSFISLISRQRIQQVMKFSGIIVILLGLIMLNRGLINFGYGFRSLAPIKATSQTEYLVNGNVEEYQVINMDLTYRGYSPNVLYIKNNIPVRWIINVKQMTRCTDEIVMPDYNIKKKLQLGENIIEFTPTTVGDIKFSCWMQMVWGKFVVTESDKQPTKADIIKEQLDLPEGTCSGDGSCGGGCGSTNCGCGARIRLP